jgi:signal transduction histidine kinase
VVISDVSNARPFDQNDVWLLSQFADLATIAIKNAELHTQVREFSQELEVKIAERTQELSEAKEEILAKAEQLRALLTKTIAIQEGERARIARDMHDSVIQLITGVRYEIQAAKVVGGATLGTDAQAKLATAHKILEEMKTEIRRVIYDLHPTTLDAVGLVAAIEKHAGRFQDLTGINCQVQVTGKPFPLLPSTEIAVFRIVEEATQNIASHAGAQTTCVALKFDPIAVRDDIRRWAWFDYPQWVKTRNGEHLGLLGMQEQYLVSAVNPN